MARRASEASEERRGYGPCEADDGSDHAGRQYNDNEENGETTVNIEPAVTNARADVAVARGNPDLGPVVALRCGHNHSLADGAAKRNSVG